MKDESTDEDMAKVESIEEQRRYVAAALLVGFAYIKAEHVSEILKPGIDAQWIMDVLKQYQVYCNYTGDRKGTGSILVRCQATTYTT